ncbi:hypothetical protein [Azospirillum baldaniorum]|uniref:hypothetical protein n=1 Tax=Azospirillum baldaniorum TaxID=1064539 RepID=UPI001FD41B84|nr:hypothetical protein [Azospirillum baldaniorum]
MGDRFPNHTTVWLLREALVTARAMEGLFAHFGADLKERGCFALGGQIIGASIVEAPRQRLPQEEKRQKDTQARWTVKRGRVEAKQGSALDSAETRLV